MRVDTRSWVLRFNDAISQFFNVFLFNGDPNECISGRCWREQRSVYKIIDKIFLWQKNHCEGAYHKDNNWAKARVLKENKND